MAPMFVLALVTALLAFKIVNVDAFYTKNSPVLQVDAKSYDSLIAISNHTSVHLQASMGHSRLMRYVDPRVNDHPFVPLHASYD